MVSVRDAHQLHGNAQPAAGATHATFKNRIDVELLSDFAYIEVTPTKAKRGTSGNQAQSGQLRKRIDQLLGEAIAEVLLITCGAHVLEREDRNRFLRRLGRASGSSVGGLLQRECEVGCGLEALRRVFVETSSYNSQDSRRCGSVQRSQRRRVLFEDCAQRIGTRFSGERALTRQHLVKNGAQRKNIRACIRWF